ncbi:hypothetical protein ACU4GD_30630 [Cupriavidus basilensis]
MQMALGVTGGNPVPAPVRRTTASGARRPAPGIERSGDQDVEGSSLRPTPMPAGHHSALPHLRDAASVQAPLRSRARMALLAVGWRYTQAGADGLAGCFDYFGYLV